MEPHILTAVDEHASYFRSFIKLLAGKFQPLQILCISKQFSFQESIGCFRNQTINRHIHYCLLLVTETNTRIDHEVQDYANHMYEDGTITVLCHGQEAIAEAITKSNRFFINAYSTGKLLYSHDGIGICSENLKYNSEQAALKAEKHFNHHNALADGFLNGAKTCLKNRQYNVCVFMLHQVVEQTCIALIRVFLAYRSEVHNLNRLLRLCSCFSDAPYNWFVSGGDQDHRLFEILAKSYSQSRYGNTFTVDEIDTQCLFEKVSAFVIFSNDMCIKQICKLMELSASVGESEVANV